MNSKNKKYLVNGFAYLITKNLKNYLNYEFYENFPKQGRFKFLFTVFFNVLFNFSGYFFSQIFGKLKKYKVIQINTWENFLLAKKLKGQILIGESHGFHFGLNFEDTLSHFSGIKKIIAGIVEFLFGPLIRYKIKKFDIYYVSTPNMLPFAKKIRLDSKWLPNAINIDIFKPDGNKANLIGNPVVFYPTRLHSFKNPKFGIDLFHKIKEKYPNAVLHLIKYTYGGDYYEKYYRETLIDDKTYVWHGFKTSNELAEMYRASDIVLGHFHPTLGMMSLVELEACATGTAVISYDKYEINTNLKDLEKIAFSILDNKDEYNSFVCKNREVVLKNHSPINVANKLQSDINFIDNGFSITSFSENILNSQKNTLMQIEKDNFNTVGLRSLDEIIFNFKNKFNCSFILLKGNEIVGYIIGYSDGKYGYINRFAIGKEYQGNGLGNKLIDYFSSNLKYNQGVEFIELVTHKKLNVDGFYIRNGYKLLENELDIIDFLTRKNKLLSKKEYIGDKSEMEIYIKNI